MNHYYLGRIFPAILLFSLACQPVNDSDSRGTGTIQWIRNFADTDTRGLRIHSGADASSVVAFINNGVAILGETEVGVDGDESLVIARLSFTGEPIWAMAHAGVFDESLRPAMLVYDETTLYLSVFPTEDITLGDSTYIANGGGLLLVIDVADGSIQSVFDLSAHTPGWQINDMIVHNSILYTAGAIVGGSDGVSGDTLRISALSLGESDWAFISDVAAADTSVGSLQGHRLAAVAGNLYVSARGMGSLRVANQDWDLGTKMQNFILSIGIDNQIPTWLNILGIADEPLVVMAMPEDDLLVVGDFVLKDLDPLADAGLATEFPVLTVMRLPVASANPSTPKWWWRLGDRTQASLLHASSVAMGPNGNVFLGGKFQGAVTFAERPMMSPLEDAFMLLKFDSDGFAVWARYTEGGQQVIPSDVALDAGGNPLVGGSFQATPEDGSASSLLPLTLFLIKFTN